MIKLDTPEFLNKEKKKLLERVTIYIGNKIRKGKEAGEYDYNEMARFIGVQNARISEWKDFETYKQSISENDLEKCIEGAIVTVDELVMECSKTEKEVNYLSKFKWLENKLLKEAVENCKNAGASDNDIIKALDNLKKSLLDK